MFSMCFVSLILCFSFFLFLFPFPFPFPFPFFFFFFFFRFFVFIILVCVFVLLVFTFIPVPVLIFVLSLLVPNFPTTCAYMWVSLVISSHILLVIQWVRISSDTCPYRCLGLQALSFHCMAVLFLYCTSYVLDIFKRGAFGQSPLVITLNEKLRTIMWLSSVLLNYFQQLELGEIANQPNVAKKKKKILGMSYIIDENPPWALCFLLGFQVALQL